MLKKSVTILSLLVISSSTNFTAALANSTTTVTSSLVPPQSQSPQAVSKLTKLPSGNILVQVCTTDFSGADICEIIQNPLGYSPLQIISASERLKESAAHDQSVDDWSEYIGGGVGFVIGAGGAVVGSFAFGNIMGLAGLAASGGWAGAGVLVGAGLGYGTEALVNKVYDPIRDQEASQILSSSTFTVQGLSYAKLKKLVTYALMQAPKN